MASRWIGVGSSYPSESRAAISSARNPRSANGVVSSTERPMAGRRPSVKHDRVSLGKTFCVGGVSAGQERGPSPSAGLH